MLIFFIHSLEVALFVLLGTLVHRISKLYSQESSTQSVPVDKALKRLMNGKHSNNETYESKMNALHQAQSFSGIQLLDIKRTYGDLSADSLKWLREAISLYLIGAIDLIGKDTQCDTNSRKELIYLVLRSNLKITQEDSEAYFKEALYRKLSSDNDLMVRAGAKAAKAWLTNNQVPKKSSLSFQLDDWGVFA